MITKKDTTEIKDLKENVDYGFQVRAQSANGGWGDFISPIYWSSSDGSSTDDGISVKNRSTPDEKDGAQVRVAVGVIGNFYTKQIGVSSIVIKGS